jgi:hypothetical protein
MKKEGGFVVIAMVFVGLFSLLLGAVTGAYVGAKKAVEATTGQTRAYTTPMPLPNEVR